VLDVMQAKLDGMPDAMDVRRCTVEHVLATLKGWMGATGGSKNVAVEASLAIMATT
jgi:hypothetical protein